MLKSALNKDSEKLEVDPGTWGFMVPDFDCRHCSFRGFCTLKNVSHTGILKRNHLTLFRKMLQMYLHRKCFTWYLYLHIYKWLGILQSKFCKGNMFLRPSSKPFKFPEVTRRTKNYRQIKRLNTQIERFPWISPTCSDGLKLLFLENMLKGKLWTHLRLISNMFLWVLQEKDYITALGRMMGF